MALQIQNFNISEERILAIGPLYNRMEKLFPLKLMCQPNDILIFLGDSCYPYQDTAEVVKRLNELSTFFEGKKSYYILGDHDLVFKSKVATSNTDAYDWLHYKLLGVRFTYKNSSSVLLLHGGVLPTHAKMADLHNDLEISFVTETKDKKNWHKSYDGRFGYVISAHPSSKDDKVQIHKHSVSLDTRCHETGALAVQEFTKNGLGKTFYL